MRALVTGGGGFLGGRIATMLLERGVDVTVLSRRRYESLEAMGIRCVCADLRRLDGLTEAIAGHDVVFHVAALTGIWGKAADFEETNITGTRNVISACRTAGISRLIYTSSPSVVFGSAPLAGVDESQPFPERFLAHYPRTKAIAERLVCAANSPALQTVALRPHLIFGPGDPHLIPRVVERARQGRLRMVGSGRNLVDITYVDNAANAHLCAAEALGPGAACAGKAYFISQGEPVRLWPWINGILEGLRVRPVTRRVPYCVAYTAGALSEWFSPLLLGRDHEPSMTRFLAAQLAHDHYFDITAARREIGYVPRVSTEEGVRRLLDAMRS